MCTYCVALMNVLCSELKKICSMEMSAECKNGFPRETKKEKNEEEFQNTISISCEIGFGGILA